MKKTTEQFIEDAKKVHGDLYSYHLTELNGMNNKVIITCPTHGDFEQRAASHTNGSGCRLCYERQPHTNESFIKAANKKHNNKYTYDGLNYINIKTKVPITCPDHGMFAQTPNDHLQGYGCPSCGGTKPVSLDEFVKRANDKHDSYYTYENTHIVGMNTNVDITCPIHGVFNQRPADHINGSGCPDCSLGKRGRYSLKYFTENPDEADRPGVLYLVTVADKFCKVGITANSVSRRFATNEVKLVVQHTATLLECYNIEQRMLNIVKKDQYQAVGLTSRHFAGWTECFPLSTLPTLQEEFKWLS
jgi:hypothetical protein